MIFATLPLLAALTAPNGDAKLLRAAAAAAVAVEAAPPTLTTVDTPLSAAWSEQYIDVDEHVSLGSYIAMADDTTRTPLFAEAIRRRLSKMGDAVVLDIGTGAFCLLALLAAQAGARRVFAVEVNPDAATCARASVAAAEAADLIPAGVVQVFEGFSTDITLPEKVDLLVAEIVGDVASAEGLVTTMRDAQQRHLKRPHDPLSYIPQRVVTLASPASYLLQVPILKSTFSVAFSCVCVCVRARARASGCLP